MKFSPSNNQTAGDDDFQKAAGSPFHVVDVVTTIGTKGNKPEIVAIEGDSNFDSVKDDAQYQRFVRFPKFYYKRLSRYSWVVSSYHHSGFAPSPMHYRNGVMHDYVYIGKYPIGADYNTQKGQNSRVYTSLATFRTEMLNRGLVVMDWATWCTVNILGFIKYNSLDWQKTIGFGWCQFKRQCTPGSAGTILGKDGYAGNEGGIANNAASACFGIENWYGNLWNMTNGVYFGIGNKVYIDLDVENITQDHNSSNPGNYTAISTEVGNSWNNFAYDLEYPWALFPDNTSSGLTVVNDTFSKASADMICIVGGHYGDINVAGPCALQFPLGFGTTQPHLGSRAMFLS